MTRVHDLTNQTFGQLTVKGRAPNSSDGRGMWLCVCMCGAEKTVLGKNLRRGGTKSCGCLRSVLAIRKNTTHGHCVNGPSPTYEVWASMWYRCTNPKHKHYKYYGGRGIKVCEEWMRFENFLADMGERPEGLTLDRRDPNGDYEKDNCRWVEWTVQVENRRKRTKMGF